MSAYPKSFIARIKGALHILQPKQIAFLTGIPVETIRDWGSEDRCASIEADQSVANDLRIALLKEN